MALNLAIGPRRRPKKGIPEEQRQALREWYSQQQPRPRHNACIQWFKTRFKRAIGQSTVSESLSDRYKYLDTRKAADTTRNQQGQWPRLETMLYDWQLLVQSWNTETSDIVLLEKAKEFWKEIPEYADKPVPGFTPGWLQRFKQRHHIKEHVQFGEAGSVPQAAEEEMVDIRQLCSEFADEEIYNMDETGLFWRCAPHRGLSTHAMPGVKQNKARVSIVVCSNATGTNRMPLWVIGHAKTPRCLRSVNMEALGIVWRFNQKAWMNGVIMGDWLKAFYQHVQTRRVLLLLDNFSAHNSGMALSPPPPNVKIAFLPRNATSRFQPLDQGIIMSFKAHYKRQWLRFIIHRFEAGSNPYADITILQALRWCSQSWNIDVTNTTIQNCWRKATISKLPLSEEENTEQVVDPEITALYNSVRDSAQIREMMTLSNFLNPEDETPINIEQEDALQQLIERHIGVDYQENEEVAIEDNAPEQPPISLQNGISRIQQLLLFLEQQQEVDLQELTVLHRLERRFTLKSASMRYQSTLDSWFR